jgi:dTDP-4-dehydrorhamnose reductase
MRILVTGASGLLGGYLLRELKAPSRERERPFADALGSAAPEQKQSVVAWSGAQTGELFGVPFQPVDLADPHAVIAAFDAAAPTLVIHAGAVSTLAAAFSDPARARQVNVLGTTVLTERAARTRARLLFVSTDLVFDGERGGYAEDDSPSPLSVYGRTKAEAEQAVLAHAGNAVVRISLLFGTALGPQPSYLDEQRALLLDGKSFEAFEDEWRTPLDLPTAAEALVAIARSDYADLLHLGGPERLSRLEMAQRLAAFVNCDPALVHPASRLQPQFPEPRPRDTSLNSSRWRSLFPHVRYRRWLEAMPATWQKR